MMKTSGVTTTSYRDLRVWQRAMDMAVVAHGLALTLPRREVYGLASQMNRAASSVPANIAEGRARATAKDFAHFLSVARGSLLELETHILLAERVGYLKASDTAQLFEISTEVGKMLVVLRRKVLAANPVSSLPDPA